MATPDMLKALFGIPLAIALYYYFWSFTEKKEQRELEKSRIQEANIIVKGHYSPDVITAKAGKPLRVNFLRKEFTLCSERVLFPDFGKEVKLAPYQVVSTEFVPQKPGEYAFQCGEAKLKGKLVIEP